MKNKAPLVLLFCIISFTAEQVFAQQTVGVFKNTHGSYQGYTLLAPNQDTVVYLLNNCGEIVHRWHNGNRRPGLSTYLLEDGSLLRPYQIPNPVFGQNGGGGVEKLDWDGNRTWNFRYSSPQVHQHHDIAPMPNGNLLLLAFEFKSAAQGQANGRKDTTVVWTEHIVEIQPIGSDSGLIVWEWHAWDHAVQEYDSTKGKYGKISEHPELFDLNFGIPGANAADWIHGNGIDYNEELDQIIMSSRAFSEFFIIDHSTTTAEAASHTGGRYGKGGDILYRWGNPETYQRGDSTSRRLFFQHHAHWIPQGLPGAGNIIVFNNGTNRPGGNFSSIDEITPPADSAGYYTQPGTAGTFGPVNPVYAFLPSVADSIYSPFIGGCQRLPNGNTLICEGVSGHMLETNPDQEIVWDYINPSTSTGIVSQGVIPVNNNVFRITRYPFNHPAFSGKDLTPQGYMELNPGDYNCDLFSALLAPEVITSYYKLYPNPVVNELYIVHSEADDLDITIINLLGQTVYQATVSGTSPRLSLTSLKNGMYLLRITRKEITVYKRMVKVDGK